MPISITDTAFNAINGASDSTAAFVSFLTHSTIHEVYVPDGLWNLSMNRVQLTAKKKIVCGPNAVFSHVSNSPIFSTMGGYDFVATVSGTPTLTTAVLSEDPAFTTPVPVTTVTATTSTLKAGDIVKLFSDEVIQNALPGTTGTNPAERRRGEHFVVGKDPVGTTVTLVGWPRDTYTLNVRIAKLKDLSLVIEGGIFTYPDGSETVASNSADHVQFFAQRGCGVINQKVLRGWATNLNFTGCFDHFAHGCDIRNLKNQPSSPYNRYGYGILDNNSQNGIFTNNHFDNCRHGYTTGTAVVTADSPDVYNYGRRSTPKFRHVRLSDARIQGSTRMPNATISSSAIACASQASRARTAAVRLSRRAEKRCGSRIVPRSTRGRASRSRPGDLPKSSTAAPKVPIIRA